MFQFLNYLQPTQYFRLRRKQGDFVFPQVEALASKVQQQLQADTHFESTMAQAYDLSWQAIQVGYIGDAPTYTDFETLPLADEYRFAHKYFHPVWSVYILLIRLLGLRNPFKEITAYQKGRKASRSYLHKQALTYEDYTTYESALVKQQPLVSIIIPTLNRYSYLKEVLRDLEQQDYTHFEVLVVDQSTPFQEDFYRGWDLNIQVLHQHEKALWLARNTAIKRARGSFILLYDDDSRVASNWISEHMKALDYFQAEVSSGVSISQVGAEVPAHYAYFSVSSQLDTGNVMLRKEVFTRIGLFDRQFEKQRMGDGEFGMRVYLAGYLNVSNPYAKRLHLKVGSGGLREMGSWDGFRPKSWLAPRPVPSVLYFFRKYHGDAAARWALLKSIPPSVMPYRFKRNKAMLIIGALVSVLLFPLVMLQVGYSWHLSSKKLRQGARIAYLDD
ncbi:glycosyltransferase family 2 protein [Mesonia sp. HuA40]|uniref:glycosyltransferase family 2 protein n=1 Tax=Mesonia sp. HuA40 TaxID=2602761 RepID=UPI0021043BD0|nr:glycosyltransferase family A protein [Mesonia sp. HuA40]